MERDGQRYTSGKVTVFAGELVPGKSYIRAGNIVKAAQDPRYICCINRSENALDEGWLHALGVDTDEKKLLKLNMQAND